ncbi:hypothetical protein CWO28_22040 [Vibrio splendidus]|uniref:Uncharacterized protein n=1 Tax=Vibrio splendidus TaxID=29497 RepID=A0A0H3ZJC3_VIBSP|nr:hypothetical protein [Vibrio splendidus]RLQ18486.1 hypothetical protein AYK60_08525 [Vibrio sp. SBT000027]AKN36010.1 hypothetical protein [Vibrio splendidus]AKN38459.1 hypothetical protein [Vibrio splendidus]AKN39778.1 hypothetical protein [Vibrio splendidus]
MINKLKKISRNRSLIACESISCPAANFPDFPQNLDDKNVLCFCENCYRWATVDKYKKSASKLWLCAECYFAFNEVRVTRAYQVGLAIVLMTLCLAISTILYSKY